METGSCKPCKLGKPQPIPELDLQESTLDEAHFEIEQEVPAANILKLSNTPPNRAVTLEPQLPRPRPKLVTMTQPDDGMLNNPPRLLKDAAS